MIFTLYKLYILSPNPKQNPYRKHCVFLHVKKYISFHLIYKLFFSWDRNFAKLSCFTIVLGTFCPYNIENTHTHTHANSVFFTLCIKKNLLFICFTHSQYFLALFQFSFSLSPLASLSDSVFISFSQFTLPLLLTLLFKESFKYSIDLRKKQPHLAHKLIIENDIIKKF